MSDIDPTYTVYVDGKPWTPENEATARYDTVHAVAGAVLAGADTVEVIKHKPGKELQNDE